jgi:hypothetical protein
MRRFRYGNVAIFFFAALFTMSFCLPVRAQDDEKIGYIDRRGVVVIAPTFDIAGDFHGGLAAVVSDKKVGNSSQPGIRNPYPNEENMAWGYVDSNGRMVIKPRPHHRSDFSEGISAMGESGAFIDRHGNVVLWAPKVTRPIPIWHRTATFAHPFVRSFHDRLAMVRVEVGTQTSPPGRGDFRVYVGYMNHSGCVVSFP